MQEKLENNIEVKNMCLTCYISNFKTKPHGHFEGLVNLPFCSLYTYAKEKICSSYIQNGY